MTDTPSKDKPPIDLPHADNLLDRTRECFRQMVFGGILEAADEGRTFIALGKATIEQELLDELSDKGYVVEQNPCNKHGPTVVISWDGPALQRVMDEIEDNPLRSLMARSSEINITPGAEAKPS